MKTSRASRSLASRLSGYKDTKTQRHKDVAKTREPETVGGSEQDTEPQTSVELLSLLQDTSSQCSPAVDTHGLTAVLTAPLMV